MEKREWRREEEEEISMFLCFAHSCFPFFFASFLLFSQWARSLDSYVSEGVLFLAIQHQNDVRLYKFAPDQCPFSGDVSLGGYAHGTDYWRDDYIECPFKLVDVVTVYPDLVGVL